MLLTDSWKTTKSSLSSEVLRKVKEVKEDFQTERTIIVDKSFALQVAFITTIAKNPNILVQWNI